MSVSDEGVLLLSEDESCEVICDALRARKLRAELVVSATLAFRKLKSGMYAVVIIDTDTPSVVERKVPVRMVEAFPNCSFIFVSGSTRGGAVALQSVMHTSPFIVRKPIEVDDLVGVAVSMMKAKPRHVVECRGVVAKNAPLQARVTQALARAQRTCAKVAMFWVAFSGRSSSDAGVVARRQELEKLVRENDTVSHLGAQQFAVLVEDVNEVEKLVIPAARIVAAYQAPSNSGPESCHVGVAVYPNDSSTADELFMRAHSAMHRERDTVRCGYRFFDEEMHRHVVARQQLEASLHGALARGEYAVHFQPQCRLDDDVVVAVESLLRWPKRRDLSPSTFVPLLAEGEISSIEHFVLRASCQNLQTLRKVKPELRASVNVAAKYFYRERFVEDFALTLQQEDTPGDAIDVEITEDIVVAWPDRAEEIVSSLKALGVRIVIDDFGTGYSSLPHLSRLAIDALKIDGTFIRAIGHGRGDALVHSLVRLGHSLGIETIAECVENETQREYLRSVGCDAYQGYLRAEPLSSEACSTWLATT